MRRLLLCLCSLALVGAPTAPGCRKKPSREEAFRALHEGWGALEKSLRSGSSTWVVAGPKELEAPFLEDGSRWAAEELARILREEGFDDLLSSRDEAKVEPVRQVEVVAPGPLDEMVRLADARGARVIVFVGLRSVELRESTPRLLDWAYEGSVELLEPGKEGGVAWEVTGSSTSEMPNDVPAAPDEARRPLAERWARGALRNGGLALGVLQAGRD